MMDIDELLSYLDLECFEGYSEALNETYFNKEKAKQAINQLIYTQVLELIPEKLTDNVAFTIGEGEVPLTQFQIGYNQALSEVKQLISRRLK
jgi:hypothetical protein